jgi:hypothetical protein
MSTERYFSTMQSELHLSGFRRRTHSPSLTLVPQRLKSLSEAREAARRANLPQIERRRVYRVASGIAAAMRPRCD